MNAQPFLNVLVTAIITALLSGIVAALVSSYLTEGKERWALRRDKIEFIYLSTITYGNSLYCAFSDYYLVIDGHIGFNEVYDRLAENATSGDDFRKLQMNILLYEPSLNASWQKLIVSRDKVGKIVDLLKKKFKRGDDLQELRPVFHAAMVKLVESIRLLEEAGTVRGRAIAEERGQAEKLLRALCSPIVATSSFIRGGAIKAKNYIAWVTRSSVPEEGE